MRSHREREKRKPETETKRKRGMWLDGEVKSKD